MISKVITGKSFYGVCRYICKDERRAVVLETEGVRSHNYKLMAQDFEMQQALRPALKKAVFHGILSFYPGEKIDDEKMLSIAKEYLKEMGIINTQYAITKHIDRNHPHLHVIANLVNTNGETIKDNWIGLKGKKIAQQLTLKHELKQALSKNLSLTNLEGLNEKEANRYIIYQAILERLSHSKNLDDLKEQLRKQGIEALYKYKSGTQELQGISFKIVEYKYKGSEIDRKFSLKNLQRTIEQNNKLQLKPIPTAFTGNKQSLQTSHDASIKEQHNEKNSLLEQLMKPGKNDEQLPYELKRKQKKKRKRLRLY
jgi:hypothetical protein